MRDYYQILFLVVFGFAIATQAQQITTDDSLPINALIQNNLGQGCVDISNISTSVNGQSSGLSSFGSFNSASSNFPFENGILLTTGSIDSAGNSLNTSPLNEGDENWGTDTDLENALNISNTINATSIEFDFTSVANQIQFKYLLASEEYLNANPCSYSDGFAFLIKKAGTSEPYTNIALIPNTNIPVNTNTIHDDIAGFCTASNEAYFEGYNIGDTNYNGRTTVLTAFADINPNVPYHIKLVIADQGDEFYDSAVFIESNSFNASVNLGPDIVTCANSTSLDGDIQNSFADYEWFLNGLPIAGETNSTLNATASGLYTVKITIGLNNSECIIEDNIQVTLNSEQSTTNISDYILCDDAADDGIAIFDLPSKENEILSALPPSNYVVSYHLSLDDAQDNTNTLPEVYQNTTSPQTIYVRTEDAVNGCTTYTMFNLIVNQAPEINEPQDIIACNNGTADASALINLNETSNEVTGGNPNLFVSYHFTPQDANSGANPVFSPYNTVNSEDTLYIRVFNAETGCFNTTSVHITVQESPIVNADQNQWLGACDQGGDGFADFDLTEVIDDILQGLTGVSVSFHLSESDAQTGNNPIADASNYQNVVSNLQLIYIRIVDEATGCSTIVPLEIHTSIVETGVSGAAHYECDDPSGDDVETFDLQIVATEMIGVYEELVVTFYETQEDLDNGVNALDDSIPYEVDTEMTLYATVANSDCIEFAVVLLIVTPPIDIQPGTVDYCDVDTDGFTSIDLESFNDYVSTGVNGASVSYYLTEDDATNQENALPPYYYNTSNPQLLWVRVENSVSGCYDVALLTINVTSAPTAYFPTDLIVCDNDTDGFYVVDLTSKIPEITEDTSNLELKFFDNYDNAFNDVSNILEPESYNTASQNIYVRVENVTSGCFNIVWFYTAISALLENITISNFANCEPDGNLITDFYFYLKDAEILEGLSGFDVLYFETEQDAIDRTNIIDKFAPYQNTTSPQAMYIRIESIYDIQCFGTYSFDIEVGALPLFNAPSNFFVCDDASNDGVENFNFNDKVDEISEGISQDLEISFHLSQYEAELDLNELPLNFTNTSNPQQIFVRIENGTYCTAVSGFQIDIIQLPIVGSPSDLVKCDTDYDGFVNFDISEVEIEILDVRQDDIIITYHESFEGAETDTEIIGDPENYTNTSNPQTVYIKINNTISDCSVALPINLSVDLPPLVNDFETYDICENVESSFDLSTIDTVVNNTPSSFLISYYGSLSDAENNINALSTDYTYTSNTDTIFIRIENPVTGCWTTYNFDLVINALPIANTPGDLRACDDISNDNLEEFDIYTLTPEVLGSQDADAFTVTYYANETDAISETNPLDNFIIGQDSQTIYVRVENNETGCFSTTQFGLIINEHPNTPNPIANCDDDYDGITMFDLTQVEPELFDTLNPDVEITYFESLTDLESNTSPIANPAAYENISSPQTIFVKVYNTISDCFQWVSLEIDVNLPPEINPVQTYNACIKADGFVTLSDFNVQWLDQSFNIIVSYYASENDAFNQSNPLEDTYFYTSNVETLFLRVEFSTTHCFYIHEFNLVINERPIANQPPPLETCDDDYDQFFNFDFTQQNQIVLGNQTQNDHTVSYYLNLEDAENAINALSNDFEATNNDIIFVRVENNTTGCFSLTQFETIVRPKPIVDIPDQVICLDDLPLLVSANTNNPNDSYEWSTNAISPEIEITEVGTYSVTVTSEYECTTTTVFNVSESEAASIDFTETVDFSNPNNITITISGIGNYLYQLDDLSPQESNVFENVTLGYHTVTVIDLNGCSEVTKDVVVIDAPAFVTPNGDGYFDTWHITGVETLPGTMVYIFDRYGKLLTTLSHTSQGWDGTYNGHQMPATDYWFLAKVKKGEIDFEVRGHFSLRL
ncbi:T9SS type B sorting domain-containing protein [Sediminibacter sp. Hel_I_10]|uniref:T9SS type B sorting domain-containing protein n=1 Tax=Sediminibacter sp. Hel_I_10 TaxID=1392490 RepID=UPI00068FB6D2|nr:choice-of-anchor L domain-containing protein [Sediminibacter sp. Hel_I_10]